MSRARALLLAVVGLLLPAGLALGVYVSSAGSLAAVPTVIDPPVKIARATTTETQPTTESTPTTTSGDDDGRDDDLSGKCKDPEHSLDPDCDPRSAADDDDDSSGHGSGSDDDSSGPGSGDD
ncbi:MAG: hypothetical protein ACREJR_09520 [Candidatus Rokuibacteriota bacterium]